MTDHQMYDLYYILIAIRMRPSAIPALALAEVAELCGTSAAADFQQTIRRHGVTAECCCFACMEGMPVRPCGTKEEIALMRDIFHTASVLRRNDQFSALYELADAAHNFPLTIARQQRGTIPYLQSELERFTKMTGMRLLPAPLPMENDKGGIPHDPS